MNSVLTASLHKMESNNKELKELYEFEVLKNKELSISKSKEPQQLTLIEAENESKTSEIIVHHVAGINDNKMLYFYTFIIFINLFQNVSDWLADKFIG